MFSDEHPDPDATSILGGATLAPTQALATSESAGMVIGRYLLLQKIGEGGMGEVWLAEQQEPVRRRVALKLIKAGMDTREVVARFESERQAVALMDHPAIAKVFDAGSTPTGRPYFVMEYVAGTPITNYCDNHRLTTAQRMELFMRVCEGVQHAHQKAVIHRDLKPSNILVREVDGKPAPRIIDFGVARATSQWQNAETRYTRFGAIVGTLGYMSPEQADSAGEDIDTRSDVYSLGVILYELLVGAPPLDFHRLPYDVILRRLRSEDALRPSARLRTLNDDSAVTAQNRGADMPALKRQLKGDGDAIALKALEKDRNRRYAAPSELAADIGRYLRNEPVLARPASATYRSRKYISRHRMGVSIAAAGLLLLVAFAVVQAFQLRRITRERALAEQRASDLVDLANRTLFDVHAAIAPLPGALAARRKIVKTTLDYLERLEHEGRRDERTQRVLSDAYLKVGMIQGDPFNASLQDFDGARQSLHKAEALLAPPYRARSNDADLMERWVETESALAALAGQSNQRQPAVQALLKLLPIAHQLGVLRPGDSRAASLEAFIYWQLADLTQVENASQALDYCNQEIGLLRDLIARFPSNASLKPDLGVALGMAAGAEMRKGDLERAAELYRQSINLREELMRADPNDVGLQRSLMVAYGNYAAVLGIPWMPNLGKPEEAREACTRAVGMARRLVSADAQNVTARIDLGRSLTRLGSIEPLRGAIDESLANSREAITILEAARTSSQKAFSTAGDLGVAREYAGHRLESLGRRVEAAQEYKEALAIVEPFVGTGNPSIIVGALANEEALALLYASSDNRAAALDYATRALTLAQQQTSGPDDSHRGHLSKALYVLASVQLKSNDRTSAHETASKAAAMWRLIENRGILSMYRKEMRETGTLLNETAGAVRR